MIDWKKIQAVIGYEFQDDTLLRSALTHSSYANELRRKGVSDNERLEFLGDAVLELVTSDFLYSKYPDYTEGKMTKIRASLVCEQSLAQVAADISLGSFLFLGKGEQQTGGRRRKSVLSDAVEAVIGAIYLDGGFANAKEFVLKFILTDIEKKSLFFDSKTILQEYVQAQDTGALSYRLLSQSGPEHDKHFEAAAYVGEKQIATGTGHTKKAAEQEAAYHALLELRNLNK